MLFRNGYRLVPQKDDWIGIRQLDVTLGKDADRTRKENSPLNLNTLRKTALALLKQVDLGRIGPKSKCCGRGATPKFH